MTPEYNSMANSLVMWLACAPGVLIVLYQLRKRRYRRKRMEQRRRALENQRRRFREGYDLPVDELEQR